MIQEAYEQRFSTNQQGILADTQNPLFFVN